MNTLRTFLALTLAVLSCLPLALCVGLEIAARWVHPDSDE